MAKYYFSPKIKYSTFKKLNTALYKGSGSDIHMVHFDKMVWQLLRDRKLNIYVDTKKKDPVGFSLKPIPKGSKIISDK